MPTTGIRLLGLCRTTPSRTLIASPRLLSAEAFRPWRSCATAASITAAARNAAAVFPDPFPSAVFPRSSQYAIVRGDPDDAQAARHAEIGFHGSNRDRGPGADMGFNHLTVIHLVYLVPGKNQNLLRASNDSDFSLRQSAMRN